MISKLKNNILPIVFIAVLLIGLFGTVITQGKQIAWNTIKNSDAYKVDDSISGKVNAYIDAFDSAVNEGVFLKSKYIDLFGILQNVMNKDVIPLEGFTGTIVRGSDNKLYAAASVTIDSNNDYSIEDINEYSEAIIRLSDSIKRTNTDLLYVQAPQKYNENVAVPIPINAQKQIARKDAFFQQINGKINSIDLTEKIYEDKLDYGSLFFSTDHHWNVDSAFWCYQEICKYLNDNLNYGINIQYYDSNNWDKIVLENSYLGSTGVRVGGYYVGKDDFSLYTPKFKTDYERHYMSNYMVDYKGDFAHCILNDYDELINRDYNSLIWGVYTGSDSPYVYIENKLCSNNKRILIVKDSFGLPVSAFMSTICKDLVIYDLRYSHDKTLKQFIEDEEFDLVVFVYNPESLSKRMFSFE